MNIGTKIESLFKGFWDNTMAVSPVVASLVLVVVAITGAAGVGMIQGSLSSDVSDEASVGDMGSASSTELLIAGSTTVQPVSELLAEAYMNENQGVRVTVQGGGSGAGVSSTGLDIVDIGAASRAVKSGEMDKYPTLQTHKIGGSAVVVIASDNITAFNAYKDDLKSTYELGTPQSNLTTAGVTTLYQRAEASGTEETFAKWLGLTEDTINKSIVGKTGNAGVLKAVQDTDGSMGFVDFGFAESLDGVVIVGIIDGSTTYAFADVDADHIEDELKNENGAYYATGLTRPLNYITNGEPSAIENAYITFAMSPGATTYFEECGYFAITQFA